MKLIFVILAIALCSCSKDGIEKKSTDNPEFNVTLLFTVDGCKVYRFEDGGRSRYFVTKEGSVSSGYSTHSKNSSTWNPEEIQTIELNK